MKELIINGQTLKVGSLIKSPKTPTSLNVRVVAIRKVNDEIAAISLRIGCCARLSIKPEDITEIINQ